MGTCTLDSESFLLRPFAQRGCLAASGFVVNITFWLRRSGFVLNLTLCVRRYWVRGKSYCAGTAFVVKYYFKIPNIFLQCPFSNVGA